jgi:hypothetical protein
MRGYVGMTAKEVADFLATANSDLNQLFAPTPDFASAHPDLSEEEAEFLLTMLAAEDAVELAANQEEGAPCVLAFEIPSQLIADMAEFEIIISAPLSWEFLQCLFTVTTLVDNDLDLAWFAPEEIALLLPEWMR